MAYPPFRRAPPVPPPPRLRSRIASVTARFGHSVELSEKNPVRHRVPSSVASPGRFRRHHAQPVPSGPALRAARCSLCVPSSTIGYSSHAYLDQCRFPAPVSRTGDMLRAAIILMSRTIASPRATFTCSNSIKHAISSKIQPRTRHRLEQRREAQYASRNNCRPRRSAEPYKSSCHASRSLRRSTSSPRHDLGLQRAIAPHSAPASSPKPPWCHTMALHCFPRFADTVATVYRRQRRTFARRALVHGNAGTATSAPVPNAHTAFTARIALARENCIGGIAMANTNHGRAGAGVNRRPRLLRHLLDQRGRTSASGALSPSTVVIAVPNGAHVVRIWRCRVPNVHIPPTQPQPAIAVPRTIKPETSSPILQR